MTDIKLAPGYKGKIEELQKDVLKLQEGMAQVADGLEALQHHFHSEHGHMPVDLVRIRTNRVRSAAEIRVPYYCLSKEVNKDE